MNVTEMHIAVQQGVDKINSLQADSLLSEEIDLELNKSVFRFINGNTARITSTVKDLKNLRNVLTIYELSYASTKR